MSQTDVLKILKDKRNQGDDSFYDCNECRKLLKNNGLCISSQAVYYNVMRLQDKGFLEVNNKWPRKFRFKK